MFQDLEGRGEKRTDILQPEIYRKGRMLRYYIIYKETRSLIISLINEDCKVPVSTTTVAASIIGQFIQ